jgi:hypothetical protein
MCNAICFARSVLVCMRYWTVKIYCCLISFTRCLLFVVSILFLILNFFSHCLFIAVARPRLYLTSHLWSLVTCICCWWWVVKWQSTCWIGLLFVEEKHTERTVTSLELIVVIIIVTITIRIPRAQRRIWRARVADCFTGGTARSSSLYPVLRSAVVFIMNVSHVIPLIYSFRRQR